MPYLLPGLRLKMASHISCFYNAACYSCRVTYSNKERLFPPVGKNQTLHSWANSATLSLHPPGGQLLASWLTAAPPSVCRLLTCWVDKHSRALGALPADTAAACCRPACVAGPGESSRVEQTLPSHPVLSCPVGGRGGGHAELSGNVLIGLHNWKAFTLPSSWNISSPKLRTFCFLCFSFYVSVSYINYVVRWASPHLI